MKGDEKPWYLQARWHLAREYQIWALAVIHLLRVINLGLVCCPSCTTQLEGSKPPAVLWSAPFASTHWMGTKHHPDMELPEVDLWLLKTSGMADPATHHEEAHFLRHAACLLYVIAVPTACLLWPWPGEISLAPNTRCAPWAGQRCCPNSPVWRRPSRPARAMWPATEGSGPLELASGQTRSLVTCIVYFYVMRWRTH